MNTLETLKNFLPFPYIFFIAAYYPAYLIFKAGKKQSKGIIARFLRLEKVRHSK